MTDSRHAVESPTVLANRGVPVLVHKTKSVIAEGAEVPTYEPLTEEVVRDGDTVTEFLVEHRFVHMPGVVMAWCEEFYGSIEKWQEVLAEKPMSVVLGTLSALWRVPKGEVSAMLLEGRLDEYVLALQVAAYRAQGVPVDDLGKLLKRGLVETKTASRLLTALIAKTAEELPDVPDEEIDAAISEALGTTSSTRSSEPTSEPENKDANQAPTRGRTGSPRGSKRVAASTSSGRSAPHKSPSRSKRS